MACVQDLACNIIAISPTTNWSQEISWNFGIWDTKGGSKWLWGNNCGFLMVDVCFANIPDLSLCFFDLLCHLDLFTEESDSKEEVTDDSPKGSSDDWLEDTFDTSRHRSFCSGNMKQGWAGFLFLDGLLDLSMGGLWLS